MACSSVLKALHFFSRSRALLARFVKIFGKETENSRKKLYLLRNSSIFSVRLSGTRIVRTWFQNGVSSRWVAL